MFYFTGYRASDEVLSPGLRLYSLYNYSSFYEPIKNFGVAYLGYELVSETIEKLLKTWVNHPLVQRCPQLLWFPSIRNADLQLLQLIV
jgi:hypothetical protein